jgi:hypothetical protein
MPFLETPPYNPKVQRPNTQRINLKISDEQLAALKKLADEKDRSVQSLIRKGVEYVTEVPDMIPGNARGKRAGT